MTYFETTRGGLARATDPDTSVLAAQSVDARRDREIMRAVFADGHPRTARSAALEAAGPGAEISRVESLRRRVSDLTGSGELVSVGVEGRERLLLARRAWVLS